MLESISAPRWAWTLRSSSDSPLLLPTPWVATTIAATTKATAASEARAAARDQRFSQANCWRRFMPQARPRWGIDRSAARGVRYLDEQRASSAEPAPRTPVVPLEAGAGPDNPPCPACGEPLFGWIDSRQGLAGPVARCESCGLGVVGGAAGLAEALAVLDRLRRGDTIRIADRAGFAAWIGGTGWAGP